MTTLFRQGVESCLQSKERHRTQVPPAEGSSGEAGARQASWGQGSRKVGSKLWQALKALMGRPMADS